MGQLPFFSYILHENGPAATVMPTRCNTWHKRNAMAALAWPFQNAAMTIRTLRMQLNTFYSGPQAWFFLADERGYLRDEGLTIEFTEGDTAANTIPAKPGKPDDGKQRHGLFHPLRRCRESRGAGGC